LLYASGARVSELVALDRSAVDLVQAQARLHGKSDKQRLVPLGTPAVTALHRWLDQGQPKLLNQCSATPSADSDVAVFLSRHGLRIGRSEVYRMVRARALRAGVAMSVLIRCATAMQPICWRVGPTCAACRSCWDTPRWQPPRPTPTFRRSTYGRCTPSPIRGHDITQRRSTDRFATPTLLG
jgi:hypothetical protein